MWYKIPTHAAKIYKGWKIEVDTVGTFGKALMVTISPGAEYNYEAHKNLSKAEQAKAFIEIYEKLEKYTHKFKVDHRTLGIFEFTVPWDKAFEEAEKYIDRIGPFDLIS